METSMQTSDFNTVQTADLFLPYTVHLLFTNKNYGQNYFQNRGNAFCNSTCKSGQSVQCTVSFA